MSRDVAMMTDARLRHKEKLHIRDTPGSMVLADWEDWSVIIRYWLLLIPKSYRRRSQES